MEQYYSNMKPFEANTALKDGRIILATTVSTILVTTGKHYFYCISLCAILLMCAILLTQF